MPAAPFGGALTIAQLRGEPKGAILEKAAKVFHEIGRLLVALPRVRRQAPAGDAFQAPGHIRTQFP